jgi:tRNA wybutosine-synthesizing protein 4
MGVSLPIFGLGNGGRSLRYINTISVEEGKANFTQTHSGTPSMRWQLLDRYITRDALYLARFGASVASYGGEVVIVGGIGCDGLIPEPYEMVVVNVLGSTTHIDTRPIKIDGCSARPLLVGHSVTSSGKSLLIMGGGAVCFSFGTFWNKGCYTLSLPNRSPNPSLTRFGNKPVPTPEPWKYLKTVEMESASKVGASSVVTASQQMKAKEPIVIRRKKISSASDFVAILASAQPVVLESLDLGPCTDFWTNEYLLDRIGRDRQVSLPFHVS